MQENQFRYLHDLFDNSIVVLKKKKQSEKISDRESYGGINEIDYDELERYLLSQCDHRT